MKPKPKRAAGRRRLPLRVLPPPAAPPIDQLEQERAAADFIDPEEEIRERQQLVDRHRGERSDLLARQARETADLLVRHRREEHQLEHRQHIEMGRLRESHHPGRSGAWLEHQEKRGPRA